MENVEKLFKQSLKKLAKGVDSVYYTSYDVNSDKIIMQGVLKDLVEPSFGLIYFNDSTKSKQFYHHYGVPFSITEDSKFGLIIDSSNQEKVNVFFQHLSNKSELFLSSSDETSKSDVFISYNEFLYESILIIGFRPQTDSVLTFQLMKSFTHHDTKFLRYLVEKILPEKNKSLFEDALLQLQLLQEKNSGDKF